MGARQHNENRRIAGDGRWMGRGGPSVCLDLQQLLSKTEVYLLQIKTNGSVPSENLDL